MLEIQLGIKAERLLNHSESPIARVLCELGEPYHYRAHGVVFQSFVALFSD